MCENNIYPNRNWTSTLDLTSLAITVLSNLILLHLKLKKKNGNLPSFIQDLARKIRSKRKIPQNDNCTCFPFVSIFQSSSTRKKKDDLNVVLRKDRSKTITMSSIPAACVCGPPHFRHISPYFVGFLGF